MNQNIALFFQKVATDADLQAKVRAVSDFEGVASLAREEKFSFDVEELEEAACLALSEEQLETIAGGAGGGGDGMPSQDHINKVIEDMLKRVGGYRGGGAGV